MSHASTEGTPPPARLALQLEGLADVAHGFTRRPMHLAQRPAPLGPFSDASLRDAWSRALHPLSADALCLVSQVHGARVVVNPDPSGPLATVAEADALVSTVPGRVVAVRVADCVPVLLAATTGEDVGGVAAVHSGWRGTAAGVVSAAVDALCDAASVAPRQIVAAVGPSISGRNYEVGREVVAALEASGAHADRFVVGRSARDRPLVDVAAAVVEQLEQAGIRRVERLAVCTFEADDLWSHRRDGVYGGRQAAWIARCP